jgi:hypothetical protein
MRGEGVNCGDSANEYSCAHGAQINFGDLTPYLTYGVSNTIDDDMLCWQICFNVYTMGGGDPATRIWYRMDSKISCLDSSLAECVPHMQYFCIPVCGRHYDQAIQFLQEMPLAHQMVQVGEFLINLYK